MGNFLPGVQYAMHFSPRLKQETTAIGGIRPRSSAPQEVFLNGFVTGESGSVDCTLLRYTLLLVKKSTVDQISDRQY